MRVLKVEKNGVVIEISSDEIGILHYALYDYLVKAEERLKRKDVMGLKELHELKDRIESMVETVNGLI